MEVIKNNKRFIEEEFEVLEESVCEYYNKCIKIIPDLIDPEIVDIIKSITNNHENIEIFRTLARERFICRLVEFIKLIVKSFLSDYINLEYEIGIDLDISSDINDIKEDLIDLVICDIKLQDVINNCIETYTLDSCLPESDINFNSFENIINNIFALSIDLVKEHYDPDKLIYSYKYDIKQYYKSFNNNKYLLDFVYGFELIYISSGLTQKCIKLEDNIVVSEIYNVLYNGSFKIKFTTNNGIMTLNNEFELIPDDNDRDVACPGVVHKINERIIYIDEFVSFKNSPSHLIGLRNNNCVDEFSESCCVLFSIDNIIYITKQVGEDETLTNEFKIYKVNPA